MNAQFRGIDPGTGFDYDADRRAYQHGFRRGFWTAAALYVVGSVLLILAFHALAVHP